MIRIICTECKNAYLQNKDKKLVCPSCGTSFDEEYENLLSGVQYYNEENFTECDNALMKFIVKNGAEPFAIMYKALCDARDFDEDTISLQDTYKKIIDASDDVSDEAFPRFIAIANDETEKIEKLIAENQIRLFADADAEKIKNQVKIVLNLESEARAFRTALSILIEKFNERSPRKISAKLSECFFVEKDIAAEVGEIKYQKICDNVASHTVFTGILTNDIKNLEIYYRCIVMFFRKSYDKYKFLLEHSEKFIELAKMLEAGQYNTLKGVDAIANKLKTTSYDFLQESYKEHFDDEIEAQTETIVVTEPEIAEEPEVEETVEEAVEKVTEETSDNTTEEIIEEATEEVIEEAEATASDESDEDADEISEVATTEDTEDKPLAEEKSEENTIENSSAETVLEENEINIVNEDVIEIEIDEFVEDKAEEIEDISSTSEAINPDEEAIVSQEDEKLNENESPEEETIEETEEKSDDSIIEIEETEVVTKTEEAPQYEVVEYNSPDKDDEADEIVIEEVSLAESTPSEAPVKTKKKKSHKALILLVIVIVLVGAFAGYKYVPQLINQNKYENALSLAEAGNYSDAILIFKELDAYADSKEKVVECEYNYALSLEKDGKFAEAKAAFESLGDYSDSSTRAQACAYSEAKNQLENKKFKKASKLFMDLGDYGDSKEMLKECSYQNALSLLEKKEYKSAIEIFTAIRKYSDSAEKITEAKYLYITDNFDKDNKTTVKYLNELTKENYRNCADLRKELLGSSEIMPEGIKAFVNYSSTDLETSLTELDNTRSIYFHAVVGDSSYYGKALTIKYTTAFGYSQKKTVVLSESDNVAIMSYPSTPHKNYTVEFELIDSNGQKIAGQRISF